MFPMYLTVFIELIKRVAVKMAEPDWGFQSQKDSFQNIMGTLLLRVKKGKEQRSLLFFQTMIMQSFNCGRYITKAQDPGIKEGRRQQILQKAKAFPLCDVGCRSFLCLVQGDQSGDTGSRIKKQQLL